MGTGTLQCVLCVQSVYWWTTSFCQLTVALPISSLVGDLFYWRHIIGFPRYLSLYSIFDQHILEIAVYEDRLGGLG